MEQNPDTLVISVYNKKEYETYKLYLKDFSYTIYDGKLKIKINNYHTFLSFARRMIESELERKDLTFSEYYPNSDDEDEDEESEKDEDEKDEDEKDEDEKDEDEKDESEKDESEKDESEKDESEKDEK